MTWVQRNVICKFTILINQKGFSLVELLAVVVILGIVMAISIPAVSRWISKGKQESDESQKKTLVMATQ
ncbi:MAG: prepilin-type N-terminal cleavage/methylation domain-containing protein, partial [Paludibacteraceae bacterium]|nr:prepilin-type N-terminal cleavage/methylation domain-containing protein [Paludibacteraceae bacterium]